MMVATIKNVEVKKYRRVNKDTGVSDIVYVSNRNDLDEEQHLKLLNLNAPEYRSCSMDGSDDTEDISIVLK